MSHESDNISPTAHYTGYVWYRNQLGVDGLNTWEGSLFFHALQPFDWIIQKSLGISLEKTLLQRHCLIDYLLQEFIKQHGEKNTIILEIAAGFSPRGYRFAHQYRELTYIETDLTKMHHRKTKLLRNLNAPSNLQTAILDVLHTEGEYSLSSLLKKLDKKKSIAIVMEGLIGYFDTPTVEKVFKNIAQFVKPFADNTIIADIYLDEVSARFGIVEFFRHALSRFVGSPVVYTYKTEDEAIQRLQKTGLKEVRLLDAENYVGKNNIPSINQSSLFRIIEAKG
ncbi:MAG: hypothetical protein D6767_09530 [Candidatus Hydrogenedentota bacterium]|nr:MAG: hypothetical protein D6767_09530 [Candidatus Hydrogenedentota bacterium]